MRPPTVGSVLYDTILALSDSQPSEKSKSSQRVQHVSSAWCSACYSRCASSQLVPYACCHLQCRGCVLCGLHAYGLSNLLSCMPWSSACYGQVHAYGLSNLLSCHGMISAWLHACVCVCGAYMLQCCLVADLAHSITSLLECHSSPIILILNSSSNNIWGAANHRQTETSHAIHLMSTHTMLLHPYTPCYAVCYILFVHPSPVSIALAWYSHLRRLL